jgi:hypothetical protein
VGTLEEFVFLLFDQSTLEANPVFVPAELVRGGNPNEPDRSLDVTEDSAAIDAETAGAISFLSMGCCVVIGANGLGTGEMRLVLLDSNKLVGGGGGLWLLMNLDGNVPARALRKLGVTPMVDGKSAVDPSWSVDCSRRDD